MAIYLQLKANLHGRQLRRGFADDGRRAADHAHVYGGRAVYFVTQARWRLHLFKTSTSTYQFDPASWRCFMRLSTPDKYVRPSWCYQRFANDLYGIWRGSGRKPIGLAISGGVDSMALAKLCREATNPKSTITTPSGDYPRPRSIHAFIVDHKMRERSDIEAENVAAELEGLGIESHILKLDWSDHGDPSKLGNVESIARKLRYQALGRACRQREIRSLLLAHHRDDQAETVLQRLLSNYVGSGLKGMKFKAGMPECTGIYGVDQSGSPSRLKSRPSLVVEGGGVNIFRPLLPYDKEQLVSLCRRDGVRWFEDKTNADHTLTLRNTARFLLKGNELPLALRKSRLLALATKTRKDNDEIENTVEDAFNGTHFKLNLNTGEADLLVENGLIDALQADIRLHAAFMRRVLEIVSPKSTIPIQDLDRAVDFVFGMDISRPDSRSECLQIQVAGVNIRREPHTFSQSRAVAFHRSIPTRRERDSVETLPWPGTQDSTTLHPSEWRLWDGRYWIKICPPTTRSDANVTVTVRFFCKEDISALRKSLEQEQRNELQNYIGDLSDRIRFTLPAIVVRQQDEKELHRDPIENVVALPSLGWSALGWRRSENSGPDNDYWIWDIRFKHVRLDRRLHRVESAQSE